MAVSDLLPRKSMGSKSRRQTLHDRLDYDQKEKKTKDGELVSSYMCSPETAAEEFEISKKLYAQLTGRSRRSGTSSPTVSSSPSSRVKLRRRKPTNWAMSWP